MTIAVRKYVVISYDYCGFTGSNVTRYQHSTPDLKENVWINLQVAPIIKYTIKNYVSEKLHKTFGTRYRKSIIIHELRL